MRPAAGISQERSLADACLSGDKKVVVGPAGALARQESSSARGSATEDYLWVAPGTGAASVRRSQNRALNWFPVWERSHYMRLSGSSAKICGFREYMLMTSGFNFYVSGQRASRTHPALPRLSACSTRYEYVKSPG